MGNRRVRFTPEEWAAYRMRLAQITGAPVPEDDATPSQWYAWFVCQFFRVTREKLGSDLADQHCAAMCRGTAFADQLEPFVIFHVQQSSAEGQTIH